jgi:hypothetical protein
MPAAEPVSAEKRVKQLSFEVDNALGQLEDAETALASAVARAEAAERERDDLQRGLDRRAQRLVELVDAEHKLAELTEAARNLERVLMSGITVQSPDARIRVNEALDPFIRVLDRQQREAGAQEALPVSTADPLVGAESMAPAGGRGDTPAPSGLTAEDVVAKMWRDPCTWEARCEHVAFVEQYAEERARSYYEDMLGAQHKRQLAELTEAAVEPHRIATPEGPRVAAIDCCDATAVALEKDRDSWRERYAERAAFGIEQQARAAAAVARAEAAERDQARADAWDEGAAALGPALDEGEHFAGNPYRKGKP